MVILSRRKEGFQGTNRETQTGPSTQIGFGEWHRSHYLIHTTYRSGPGIRVSLTIPPHRGVPFGPSTRGFFPTSRCLCVDKCGTPDTSFRLRSRGPPKTNERKEPDNRNVSQHPNNYLTGEKRTGRLWRTKLRNSTRHQSYNNYHKNPSPKGKTKK